MAPDTADPNTSESSRSYVLTEPLHKGGFGEVWRGKMVSQNGLEKEVAIKLLHRSPEHEDEYAGRLRDEARLLAMLRHRSIVTVDDMLRIDGRWAVVMELVDGVDLQHLAARGAMPARVVGEIGREVAFALDAAYRAVDPASGRVMRLVHRDIKPSNILLTTHGEVKVVDFGIARANFLGREAVTRSLAFGSPGYLAPERHDGLGDASCDVYALGVVLLEGLTGRRLGQLSVHPQHHAKGVADALAHLPSEARPLDPLLRRMLAYEATSRPDSLEVGRWLRDAVATLPGPWLADWAVPVVESALDAMPAADFRAPPPAAPEDTTGAEGTHGVIPASEALRQVPEGTMSKPLSPRAISVAAATPPPTPRPALARRLAPLVWMAVGLLPVVLLAALWSWWGDVPPEPDVLSATHGPANPVGAPSEPVLDDRSVSPPAAAEVVVPRSGVGSAPDAAPAPLTPPAAAPHHPSVGTSADSPSSAQRWGHVELAGDADSLSLVSATGRTYAAPGDVPAGRYALRPVFGGREVFPDATVTIEAGRTLAIRCSAAAELCR